MINLNVGEIKKRLRNYIILKLNYLLILKQI